MANPFDQFDQQATANPFDRFDAAKPPERKVGERVTRGVGLTMQSISDAGAGILGLPGDLISGAVDRLKPSNPNPENDPVIANALRRLQRTGAGPPTSEQLRGVLDQVATVPGRIQGAISQGSIDPLTAPATARINPENTTEQIVAGGARGVGDAAAFLTGMGALKMSATAGSAVDRIARTLMKAPGTQVAANAVGGATTEATGSPWAGLGAALTTGGLPSAVRGAGRTARTALIDPFTETGAKRAVGEFLPQQAGQTPDALADALMYRKQPPLAGSVPTTAEVARNPGLAGVERMSRGQSPNDFGARDIARNEARLAQVDTLGPGVDATRAGTVIRSAVEPAEEAARGTTNRAYDQARTLSANVSVDPQPVYTAAADRVAQVYGNQIHDTPPEIVRALQAMRAPNVTLEQLEGVRRAMSAMAGETQRHGATASGVAGHVARQIDQHIDSLVQGGTLPKDVADAWTAARAARRQQGDVFQNPTTGPVTATDRFGNPKLYPGEVPGQFANTGASAAGDAATFGPATGNNPQAAQALDQYIVGKVRQQGMPATQDGMREQQLAKALQNWRPAMEAVPGMGPRAEGTLNPVLADLESARFAKDAGRGVGSNTFQNFAINRSVNSAAGGLPVASIPGVSQIASLVTKPLRSTQGFETRLKEALAEALLNPDKAAEAIRLTQSKGGTDVRALLASILAERTIGDRPRPGGKGR